MKAPLIIVHALLDDQEQLATQLEKTVDKLASTKQDLQLAHKANLQSFLLIFSFIFVAAMLINSIHLNGPAVVLIHSNAPVS